jgi:hypothetical protein
MLRKYISTIHTVFKIIKQLSSLCRVSYYSEAAWLIYFTTYKTGKNSTGATASEFLLRAYFTN